jgi:hypothetical protein
MAKARGQLLRVRTAVRCDARNFNVCRGEDCRIGHLVAFYPSFRSPFVNVD